MRTAGGLIARLPQPLHAIGDDGTPQTLQRHGLLGSYFDERLEPDVDPLRDQDFVAGCLRAQPCGEIGDRADRAVIPTTFESDRTDRRKSLRDADAEAQVVAAADPLLHLVSNA